MKLIAFTIILTIFSYSVLIQISQERLNEIASIINSTPNITWQAEPPSTSISSSLASTILTKHDTNKYHPLRPSLYSKPSRLTLPDNFNLQTYYPQCKSISTIHDQANCGSCWAVSTASVISDRICIQSKQQLHPIISSNHIITCCFNCGFQCGGGFTNAAFHYWTLYGVPTGGDYGDVGTCQPYFLPPCSHFDSSDEYPECPDDVDAPFCEDTCVEGYGKEFDDDLYFGKDYYYLRDDEEEIMEEIYLRGSVQASYEVYEDFVTYKSGVYQYKMGDYIGGHAIKIIGWGIEKGVKYWLCVNSWNEGWGDKGMFKILRGRDECGIESEVMTGNPQL